MITTQKMVKEKRFERVVEGWDSADTFLLSGFTVFLMLFIYFTITRSPYFVFLVLIFSMAVLAGFAVHSERKIYWREI